MKRNIVCGFAASLLSLSLLVSPAMAQAPGPNWDLVETNPHRYFEADPSNPGAGWVLVGSDTVRYFIPGSTPPAGTDLSSAGQAPSLTSQDPSSGDWLLVGSENVKDFIADTDGSGSDQLTASTFVNTRNEEKVYSAGRHKLEGEPTYDAAVRQTDTKTWRLTSQTATIRRYDVPVTRNVHTPYRIVDRFGYDTRTVDTYDNSYRANQIVNTALGQELVDTHTYTKREEKATPWVRGAIAPALDKLISTGVDDSVQTTYQAYVVDLLAGRISESSKTQGAKSSTFLSDSGSGNTKTALSGSQKRVAFKADEAIASTAKKVDGGGSIKDPTLGKAEDLKAPAKKADVAVKEVLKKADVAVKEVLKKVDEAVKEVPKNADEAVKEVLKKAVNVKATDWDRKFYNPSNSDEYLDFSESNGNKLSIVASTGKLSASGWSQGMLSADKGSYVDDDGSNSCNLRLSNVDDQWVLNGSIGSGNSSVPITNWVAR